MSHVLQQEQLARQIERDIHRRGLQPGQRYLSTRQVKQLYGVSLAVATQAMQSLVDRKVLVRRDRSGTFVGSQVRPSSSSRVKMVCVLVPVERMDFAAMPFDLLMESLRRLPLGAGVQFSFLPQNDEVGYLRELLEPMQAASQLAGVIPVSCSREAYRYLDELGTPMVVLGTPDPDQQHLPSVDGDHFESGRLLTEHLLAHGHQQLALLTPSGGRAGDHAFLDGIVEAMTAANRPPNALVSRICSHDPELFRAQARAVLARESRPTGVICRSQRMLGAFFAALADLGLSAPKDVEVVYERSGSPSRRAEHPPYTHVRSKVPYEQIADQIAALLHRLCTGEPVESHRVVVPVELEVVKIAGSGS